MALEVEVAAITPDKKAALVVLLQAEVSGKMLPTKLVLLVKPILVVVVVARLQHLSMAALVALASQSFVMKYKIKGENK
jgi:hypothetical protein